MTLSSIRSILDETLDRLSLSNLLPHDCSHLSKKNGKKKKKKDLAHEIDRHDSTHASILAILKREQQAHEQVLQGQIRAREYQSVFRSIYREIIDEHDKQALQALVFRMSKQHERCHDPCGNTTLEKTSNDVQTFIRLMRDCRDYALMEIEMMCNNNTRKSQEKRTSECAQRIREAQADASYLSSEIEKVKDERDRDIERLVTSMNKIQSVIQDIVHNSEAAANLIEHDANQKEFACLTAHEEAQGKIQDQMLQLTTAQLQQHAKAQTDEQEVRVGLNKVYQKEKVSITHYDTEMQALASKYKTLKQQFEEEKKELAELSVYFSKIDDDQRHADAEQAGIDEILERQHQAQRKLNQCIAKIQAIHRGHITRRRLAQGTKKKKKNKKDAPKKGSKRK